MGLFDAFSDSANINTANQTAKKQKKYIKQGQQQATTDINTGVSNAAPEYQQSVDTFAPYNQSGTGANKLLSDITGVNGTDAQAAAQKLIETNPGYQYALDQGTQTEMRNAANLGSLDSGNTREALAGYAANLAMQMNYLPWIQQLQGLSGQGIQGAAGMAQGLTNLGDLYQNQGTNLANVDTGAATNLANISGQQGANVASARNTADANTWGAILGLTNAAAQGAGAAFG